MLKRTGIKTIRESDYGVYVWKLPSGNFLADTDFNILNVESRFGDIQKMKILQDTASYWGYPDGTPEFIDGVYRVTDEEYEEQIAAMLNGQMPDAPKNRR